MVFDDDGDDDDDDDYDFDGGGGGHADRGEHAVDPIRCAPTLRNKLVS